MGEIVRREITPFNEFWINCESTMLHSLLITVDEKYYPLTLNNCYTYEQLHFSAPSGKSINEVRVKTEIQDMFDVVLKNRKPVKWVDYEGAKADIKKYLREGKIVLVGVDLYYWIPKNMCYGKHHVDHYAIINGFDEDKDVFFAMDTDNVKYQEFEVPMEHVMDAISHCDFRYDAYIYELCEKEELEPYMLNRKELIRNAKRIKRSLRPLRKKYFWLMEDEDYEAGFYRDMCVMYILQINCRMKANQLLIDYLINKEGIVRLQSAYEKCSLLERGWTSVRNRLSKAYFSEACVTKMLGFGEEMMQLFIDEMDMWKLFINAIKNADI